MLKYKIVNPSSIILSGEADMIIIPCREGEIGVLPSHSPMINLLKPGLVKVYQQNHVTAKIFVESGIVRIDQEVNIIVEKAKDLVQITLDEAKERLKTAESELKLGINDEDRINEYAISKTLLEVMDEEINMNK